MENEVKTAPSYGPDENEFDAISSWSLVMPDVEKSVGIIKYEGINAIIVENIGHALMTLKPASGDYSIINYFVECTKKWLARHKAEFDEILEATEIWINFSARVSKENISLKDFLNGRKDTLATSGFAM